MNLVGRRSDLVVLITIGIPILSAVAATQTSDLNGIHLALTVNVAFTLASVALVWIGLLPRAEQNTETPAESASVANKVQAR
ncbi:MULTISPECIES: hypothetical protein [unclassified Spirillospora]|uniref:hypothetical protein n=1 Tax=unclassified Spirillospora TaxID=2642701 RepID=UPI00371AA013